MMSFFRTLSASVIAATFLFTPIAASQAEVKYGRERIQVAFVLDTTGSMANLIDGAKRKIWSIANTIVDIHPEAEIKMALIGFRDRGDDYVIKTYDMSSDIQGLYGNLIQFQAQGGGDTPESVNEALNAAVRDLDWNFNDNVRRIVFLVGDSPPHMDYDNSPQYPEIIDRAKRDDIVVNTVQAGDNRDTTMIWKEMAQMGNGRYIQIPQDGGRITIIETPFDGDIIILQKRLDETVIPYGDIAVQEAVREKMETKSVASDSVQVDNSTFYSKRTSKREVITGGGDLIAEIRNGDMSIDDIETKKLPENVKGMSAAERDAYIEEKLAARIELEEAMSKLVDQRDAYVADKLKSEDNDNTDSFDRAVKQTLKEQLM